MITFLQFRIIEDSIPAARSAGWSKNHRLIEVYAVGKWRAMGFYTRHQFESGNWRAAAYAKLRMNGGLPRPRPDSLEPDPCPISSITWQDCTQPTPALTW